MKSQEVKKETIRKVYQAKPKKDEPTEVNAESTL